MTNDELRCVGKNPFSTHRLAAEVAAKGRKKGQSLGVYKCRTCSTYHIGHETPSANAVKYKKAKVRFSEL